MERSKARCVRNACIAIFIGGGHLLLVLMGLYFNRLNSTTGNPVTATPVFVMLTFPSQQPIALALPVARRRIVPSARRAIPNTSDVPAAATPQREAAAIAPIDWERERQLAARAAARAATRGTTEPKAQVFGAPLTPQAVRCKPLQAEFNWDPEPKKGGFIGVLPYVRLGRHCIVGLGFFGCGLGKLPEANSRLLTRMQDADRHRSSVPDTPTCVAALD